MSVASVATGIALIGTLLVLGPHHYDHLMELRKVPNVPMSILVLAMVCLAFDVTLAVFIGLTFNNGDDIDEFLFGLGILKTHRRHGR